MRGSLRPVVCADALVLLSFFVSIRLFVSLPSLPGVVLGLLGGVPDYVREVGGGRTSNESCTTRPGGLAFEQFKFI